MSYAEKLAARSEGFCPECKGLLGLDDSDNNFCWKCKAHINISPVKVVNVIFILDGKYIDYLPDGMVLQGYEYRIQ